MGSTNDRPNDIASGLRDRLSEAEPPDAEAQLRHLLLQKIAQDVALDDRSVSRRGVFRRSR